MPRGIHQKEKLLVLLEVLNRESDEEHPVPLSELLAALSREEISAERKSIYDDMEILRRRGWDVELERRRGYYLASRSHTSYGTWSRRTRRSRLSSGIQKYGRMMYLSFSSSGGNTRTNAVISVVEDKSRPP